jgi:hypothetical protein
MDMESLSLPGGSTPITRTHEKLERKAAVASITFCVHVFVQKTVEQGKKGKKKRKKKKKKPNEEES